LTPRERLGDVDRVDLAVLGQEHAADHAGGGKMRQPLGDLAGGDDLDLEPELPRHRGAALQLLEAGIGQRDGDRAVLLEAGGPAGLCLERLEQRRRVFGKLGEIAGGAQLADKARGMPGGARGQLLALEEDHVGDAEFGQMISERGADDTAANDHDVSSMRQRFRHGGPSESVGGGISRPYRVRR
jgi:hypothetical protein